MPFDSFPEHVPYNDDSWQRCPSCKRPITAHHQVEQIQLPHDPIHGADKVNGTYHTECAQPFVGLVGALNMLRRWG